jgi:hypothetical protein
MLNRIISLVLCTSLIFPSALFAQDVESPSEVPMYTHLEEGEAAPFDGTLFNPIALGTLLSENQYSLSECDLRIEFELNRRSAECQLRYDILQASYDSLNDRYDLILEIKNNEIQTYRELALERPNKNSQWWLAGGFVIGSLTSIAIFYASTEISK